MSGVFTGTAVSSAAFAGKVHNDTDSMVIALPPGVGKMIRLLIWLDEYPNHEFMTSRESSFAYAPPSITRVTPSMNGARTGGGLMVTLLCPFALSINMKKLQNVLRGCLHLIFKFVA